MVAEQVAPPSTVGPQPSPSVGAPGLRAPSAAHIGTLARGRPGEQAALLRAIRMPGVRHVARRTVPKIQFGDPLNGVAVDGAGDAAGLGRGRLYGYPTHYPNTPAHGEHP
jgi:hypothetical protein